MGGQGLSVRTARIDDGLRVHELMMSAFADYPNEQWSESDLATAFSEGDSAVLERGNSLIGYCLVRKVLDEAEILSIAIRPDARGQGAASYLLNAMLIRLRNKQVFNIHLEVRENNKHAKNLYLKNGFLPIGKREGYYTSDNGHAENAIMYKHTIKSKID